MKAIIIGGGIGGLAAAIALRQVGIEVAVFERATELREVGAGISLWPNAVKGLRLLGMAKDLQAVSLPHLEGSLRKTNGEILTREEAAKLEHIFGAPTIVLHRADLLAALLKTLGPERLTLGAEFVAFRHDASGITARFADGRTAHADFLVGADGIKSAVRAQLHGDQPPRYAGYTAWRAVVPFEVARLTPGETWGKGARFGQVPLNDGRVYWFATKTAPADQRSPDGEKAEVLRTFGKWHAPIPDLIAATADGAILRNDIIDRPPLRRWGAGLVTLLGDAAHPMTPNLGQGACQAIEDAVVLARILAEQPHLTSALRTYEGKRIPRTTSIVNQAWQFGWVGQWQHPLATRMRDFGLRHIAQHVQVRQLAAVVGQEL